MKKKITKRSDPAECRISAGKDLALNPGQSQLGPILVDHPLLRIPPAIMVVSVPGQCLFSYEEECFSETSYSLMLLLLPLVPRSQQSKMSEAVCYRSSDDF